eukprot:scaffold15_cov234-Pinguiococcus_pyrenoidosus.AAC.5
MLRNGRIGLRLRACSGLHLRCMRREIEGDVRKVRPQLLLRSHQHPAHVRRPSTPSQIQRQRGRAHAEKRLVQRGPQQVTVVLVDVGRPLGQSFFGRRRNQDRVHNWRVETVGLAVCFWIDVATSRRMKLVLPVPIRDGGQLLPDGKHRVRPSHATLMARIATVRGVPVASARALPPAGPVPVSTHGHLVLLHQVL